MFSSIVVGTDGSPTARRAVEVACSLAELSGATLHLVSAFRPAPVLAGAAVGFMDSVVVEAERDLRRFTEAMLSDLSGTIGGRGVRVETHAVAGEASDALLEVAKACAAELIVVGSKGMAGARHFVGSVPNRVSHRARTSVLIVKTT
jgi:nucleotide-binding universal stress UspA family protein